MPDPRENRGGPAGKRLYGKVAIVMGAGSRGRGWGNGKAAAVLFARAGAQVVCVDADSAAAEKTAAIITAEGGHSLAVGTDITRGENVAMVVDLALEVFDRVDILCNNVEFVDVERAEGLTAGEQEGDLALDLRSCLLGLQHVTPIMRAQGGGSIVNIWSLIALRHTGGPYLASSASKAVLNELTRASAADHAPYQIRVNAILPGLIDTPTASGPAPARSCGADRAAIRRARDAQVPMGRQGTAWDVAEAALFLASDASRYVTGIELVVDGGVALRCA